MLFVWRNPIGVKFVWAFSIWQAFLQICFFKGLGKYNFSPKRSEWQNDAEQLQNYVGLTFLVSVDCFVTMGMAQILEIPSIYPVFTREISNNMYSTSTFYLAV
jgi:hypothetical protein